VALLTIAALCAGGLFFYSDYWLPLNTSVKQYLTLEASRVDVHTLVAGTGNVAAKENVSLYVKASQKVSAVHVKEGDTVARGQKLIDFDIASEIDALERKRAIAELNLKNAELNAQNAALSATGNELLQYVSDVDAAKKSVADSENDIESRQIRINQQQIRVDDAKKAMDKYDELLSSAFATQDEYDASVSAYKNAQETLSDLQLQRSNAERELEYRRTQQADAQRRLANARDKLGDEANALRYEQQLNTAELARIEIGQIDEDISELVRSLSSPVSGNVATVSVTEGATASRSNAVITLEDMSDVMVRADISEYDAPKLKVGQPAKITAYGLPDKVYEGTVTRIAATSFEKESGSDTEVVVPVEILVDNADAQLKTGYTADVTVIIEEVKNAIYVPSQLIINDGGRAYVYVMKEPAPQDDGGGQYAAGQGGAASDGQGGAPLSGASGASPTPAASPPTTSFAAVPPPAPSPAPGGNDRPLSGASDDSPTPAASPSSSAAAPPPSPSAGSASDGAALGAAAHADGQREPIVLFGFQLWPPPSQTLPPQPELVKTEVITGLYGNNGVEIISGLKVGDRVVLNP
jgi:multidrug efflux pump subunit AcrA (membrane-fusion protein)